MTYSCYCSKWVAALLAFVLIVSAIGCAHNENLGEVTGTVTLDGEPLADAFVEFIPASDEGAPSYGRTDANGKYELKFSRSESGAWLGPNTVRITTEDVEDVDGEERFIPEKVPTQYNVNSTLTADVEPGLNTFDFDLESEGEVVSHLEGEAY